MCHFGAPPDDDCNYQKPQTHRESRPRSSRLRRECEHEAPDREHAAERDGQPPSDLAVTRQQHTAGPQNPHGESRPSHADAGECRECDLCSEWQARLCQPQRDDDDGHCRGDECQEDMPDA